jgi:chromosome segregation ATPase
LQSRVQQLEAELVRRHAVEGSDEDWEALSESLTSSQQDGVKILKQYLDDARRRTQEMKEIAECDRALLGAEISHLDDHMVRMVAQNRTLSKGMQQQQEEIREMQEILAQLQMEKMMTEDNVLMNAAGRLASTAKDATKKALFGFKSQQ